MRRGEPVVPPEPSCSARALAMKRAVADQVRSEAMGVRDRASVERIEPASAEAVDGVARLFVHKLTELYEDPSKRSWFKLFRHMDDDDSGRITYAELAGLVREELKLSPRELPEVSLKAVGRRSTATGAAS